MFNKAQVRLFAASNVNGEGGGGWLSLSASTRIGEPLILIELELPGKNERAARS